jgi:central glycolytic genes regulator
MQKLFNVQKKLLPDMLEVMTKRYHILQSIRLMGPVGRRNLAASLGHTERVLRKEVEFLDKQELISTTVQGMMITPEGEKLIEKLEEIVKEVSGLTALEQSLVRKLPISKAIVVPGDSDSTEWVKNEMGRAAVSRLHQELERENVIAVAGGTTLAAVAEMMKPSRKGERLLFVPARGGLGEQVENQANSISAKMARKADGDYRLLHVPDQLSEETYESLIGEPGVKEVLQKIKASSIVIHGIGEAKPMAIRRKSSPYLLEKIDKEKAVAEAFGYYFDKKGHVIHKVKTIGLQLEEIKTKKHVITVAGGSSKAEAIAAFFSKTSTGSVLVTDEGAAKGLTQKIDS